MIKKHWLIIIPLIMLFSFCSYQKKARGPNNEIFVLATEKTRDVIGTAIDTSFAYGMLTPVYEQFFITKWFPIEKFAPFSEYKNLCSPSGL